MGVRGANFMLKTVKNDVVILCKISRKNTDVRFKCYGAFTLGSSILIKNFEEDARKHVLSTSAAVT